MSRYIITIFYFKSWYLENQEWMDNVTSGDYQKYYEAMWMQ